MPALNIKSVPAKVLWLVDEGFFAYLGTVDGKGTPHVTPMTYVREGSSLFMFASKFSKKVANLRRNPKAALLIDVRDQSNPRNNRAVLFKGRAEVYGLTALFTRAIARPTRVKAFQH